ncbi:energy transducer TonB [Campylobacterota bacterium]
MLALFYKSHQTSHESSSLVHLQAIKFSAPTFEIITEKANDDATQQAKTSQLKKISTVQEKKPIKKIEKTKQVPVKQIETAQVEPLPIQKEKILNTENEEPVETKETEEVIEAEALVKKEKESVLAQEHSKEVASASTEQTEVKVACDKQYLQDNIALINALIKQNLYYPRIAKKRGMQGKAMVSFTLDTDGEILEIKALGSLASILSKAAIKTVQKASVSFPHPKQVLALQIPIVYKLNQR